MSLKDNIGIGRMYQDNDIHETAIIHPNVTMGTGNKIGPYCVIGFEGGIRGCTEFDGTITISDNNVFKSHVTVALPQDGDTRIMSNNLILSHVNIGHNALISNRCEIVAGAIICGDTAIYNDVMIKAGAIILPFKTVGARSIVGAGSVVTKNIDSDQVWFGNPATYRYDRYYDKGPEICPYCKEEKKPYCCEFDDDVMAADKKKYNKHNE